MAYLRYRRSLSVMFDYLWFVLQILSKLSTIIKLAGGQPTNPTHELEIFHWNHITASLEFLGLFCYEADVLVSFEQ